LAFKYAPAKCSKTLKIYVFMTQFKKQLPTDKFTTLSQNHCNSAVTTSCSPHSEIIIYREEEFMKVFIHETFHALGLDFSGMSLTQFNKKVKHIFPIKSEFNMFEAYSEFWASTMNSLISACLSEDDNFLLYSDLCIQSEQIFSLFQMVKILDFMGLTYENLFNNDNVSNNIRPYLFKEKTNVFAYYIIKNLLMYYNVDFLIWCQKHNNHLISFRNDKINLNDFLQFINEKYRAKSFLDDIKKMQTFIKKKRLDDKFSQTMRMSICEINLEN